MGIKNSTKSNNSIKNTNDNNNSNSNNNGNNNRNNNKTVKIVLCILFFPFVAAFAWIYLLYKIIAKYQVTREISIITAMLTAVSFLFFVGMIAASNDNEDDKNKATDKVIESEVNTSNKIENDITTPAPTTTQEPTTQETTTTPAPTTTQEPTTQETTTTPAPTTTPKPTTQEATTTPAPTTMQEQTTTPAPQTQENLVWICADGSKYHSKSSCSNMISPWQVSIDDAKAQGYDACKRCYK